MRTDPSRDVALLLLRLAGLYLALGHGLGKVVALATGNGGWVVEVVAAVHFPYPQLLAWVLGFTELLGGLAVAVGLYTRVAAAIVAVAMIVASFGYHLAHLRLLHWLGLSAVRPQTLEAAGSPERTLLYALVFLALAFLGAGRYSVDAHLRRSFRF